MKQVSFRTEHLLWLTPLLLGLFAFLIKGNGAIDIHLHDTYLVIDNAGTIIFVFWMVLILTPFVLHLLSRHFKKRQKLVSNVHVMASIVLMVSISVAVIFGGMEVTPLNKNYDFSSKLTYYNATSFWMSVGLLFSLHIRHCLLYILL